MTTINNKAFTQYTNILINDTLRFGDIDSNVALSSIASVQINATGTVRKLITIAVVNTYVDIDQSTAISNGSNPDFVSLNPGELTYNGDNDINVRIKLTFNCESLTGTVALNAQILQNVASLGEINGASQAGTAGSTHDLIVYVTLSKGDVIKSQLKNISNTTNFQVSSFSLEISGRTS